MAAMEAPLSRLTAAMRALAGHWGAAADAWTDQVHQQVRTDYLDPVVRETEATAKAMKVLGDVIEAARQKVR